MNVSKRETDEDLGRQVVADGRMAKLRTQLGLTRSAMAELLHTSPVTYTSWELNPGVNLWASTADRIGRFYRFASKEIVVLGQHGMSMKDLVPLYLASTSLGVAQEVLLNRYRDGEFEAEDLGILGLWVHKGVVAQLRGDA